MTMYAPDGSVPYQPFVMVPFMCNSISCYAIHDQINFNKYVEYMIN